MQDDSMTSYASIHTYIFRVLKYKTLTIRVINISLPLYTQIIGIFEQQHSTVKAASKGRNIKNVSN